MKRILLFLILTFLLFSAFFYIYILPNYNSGLFEVKKGENLGQIAENLKDEGFIKIGLPFYFYVLAKGRAADLKSGVYLFALNDTIFDMADKIIAGETVKIKTTIPEGYNLRQIDERLTKMGLIQEGDLINFNSTNFQFSIFNFQSNSKFQISNLEGFLFPDTYYFSPGAETEEIVRVFLDNFNDKLTPELREEIEKQGKTIFEIITLASLIEKEVRTIEDKELVSGILWKRLKTGMPLQVDATIGYVTGKRTARVSSDDLKIESLYNTYKYKGLPPGPISNPGIESIKATIEPKDSSFWYYLSTPEGETIFSKTLQEHNIAIAKYLR